MNPSCDFQYKEMQGYSFDIEHISVKYHACMYESNGCFIMFPHQSNVE